MVYFKVAEIQSLQKLELRKQNINKTRDCVINY